MKYDLSKEQYKSIQKLAEMKDTVDFMLNQTMGYSKISDIVIAYNKGEVKVLK